MEALKCPNCGGKINKADEDIYFCPYCGCAMESNVKKTKLNIEIKSDEKKKIEIEHKDKAKLVENISELLFLIGVIVLIIIWATNANFSW